MSSGERSNATRRAAVALVLISALALCACTGPSPSATSSADSTPTSAPSDDPPVRAVDLAAGEQQEPVEVFVDGGADGVGVTFREITIEPGAGTGEHCHHGQLIAVVKEGALTHYAPTHPGGVRVYSEGESIIEGAGYVHEGRNEGEADVMLWVTYVVPDGEPLAETDLTLCED